MQELTKEQAGVKARIHRLHKRLGYFPSQAEIAAEFGVNQTTARYYLKTLARKGHYRDVPGKARAGHLIFSAPKDSSQVSA